MKYGLIYYKDSQNLGDDIQTYSQMKLLPKVDYLIDREKISSFVPDRKENVKVLLSGWYIHNYDSLLPSPFIDPLFISIHFSKYSNEKIPSYMNEYVFNYLRNHSPIGLRDDYLLNYLKENDVDSYFSGCLTLTLKPFENIEKTEKICVVDTTFDIEEKVKSLSDNVEFLTHELDYRKNVNLFFDDRMKNVEDMLKIYQSSKLVITSRIHVALPCLALGTPVLLIYDEDNEDLLCRISGYKDMLNMVTREEFLNNPNLNIENSNKYIELRNDLLKRVNTFLIDENDKCEESIELFNEYYVKRKEYIDFVHNNEIKKLSKRINELEEFYNKNYLKLELMSYENRDEYINQLIDENNKIQSFKRTPFYFMFRVYNKIKSIIIRVLRKIKRILLKIMGRK